MLTRVPSGLGPVWAPPAAHFLTELLVFACFLKVFILTTGQDEIACFVMGFAFQLCRKYFLYNGFALSDDAKSNCFIIYLII